MIVCYLPTGIDPLEMSNIQDQNMGFVANKTRGQRNDSCVAPQVLDSEFRISILLNVLYYILGTVSLKYTAHVDDHRIDGYMP